MALAEITTALSALKTATEIASALNKLDSSISNVEQREQILALSEALVEMRQRLLDTQEIIASKDDSIVQLKEALKTKENLVRYLDAYYLSDDEGYPIDSPFCAFCWDNEHFQIHLITNPLKGNLKDCPKCKTHYQTRQAPAIFGRDNLVGKFKPSTES